MGCVQVALDENNLLRTWEPALQVGCIANHSFQRQGCL